MKDLTSLLQAQLDLNTKSELDGRGVRRWKSNDKVVPYWIFQEAGMKVSAVQMQTYENETSSFLKDYMKQLGVKGPQLNGEGNE